MTWFRKTGWHHAWIILAAACVLSIISRADSASFAVLVDPLVSMGIVAVIGWGTWGLLKDSLSLLALPGRAEEIVSGLSQSRVSINASFDGTSIFNARSSASASRDCRSLGLFASTASKRLRASSGFLSWMSSAARPAVVVVHGVPRCLHGAVRLTAIAGRRSPSRPH